MKMLGAVTQVVIDKGRGHLILENTPHDAYQYMYERLPDSGVTKDTPLKPDDPHWKRKGTLRKFDQNEIIEHIKRDYFKALGKTVTLNMDYHWLQPEGYLYIPDACVDGKKKCKMSLVLHGCGGTVSREVSYYGPVAAANDIIMVYPLTRGCWDGSKNEIEKGTDMAQTKMGIQQMFLGEILKRAKKPFDSTFDYKKDNISFQPIKNGMEWPCTSTTRNDCQAGLCCGKTWKTNQFFT